MTQTNLAAEPPTVSPGGIVAGSRGATVVLVAAMPVPYFRHNLIARGTLFIVLQIAAVILMLLARLTFGMRRFHAGANPTDPRFPQLVSRIGRREIN